MKMFIPLTSMNVDGATHTHPSKGNDLASMYSIDDLTPGPANTYMARRSLSTITTPALASKCLGFASFTNAITGLDIVIAGTSTALYRATSTITGTFTFSDISNAGGYSTATGETWEFAHYTSYEAGEGGYGVDRIIATNYSDPIQYLAFSTVQASTTQTFSVLITSPTPAPRCRHLAVIGQFLVMGNVNVTTSATASVAPSRVWWSAFGNPRNFTPSGTTQCDYEDLAAGGAVQRVTGGNEYGYVFQQSRVQIMRYVGGSTIFDFSPAATAQGTAIPRSIVEFDGAVYYITNHGFQRLYGAEQQHIGDGFVDQYFWNTVEQTRLYDVTATYDARNKLVMWAWPTGTDGFATRVLVYHTASGRWVRWSEDIEAMAWIREGMSGEMLAAFDTDHILKTFTSAAAVPAVFSTAAIQPVPGRRWQLNGIRLLVDTAFSGGTVTSSVAVQVADSPQPSAAWSSLTSVSFDRDNYARMRTAGRFQRIIVTTQAPNAGAAGATKYTGIEIDYQVLGER